ncbi:MAG TPA: LLM class flavin-dependent oxidoreductase, partial [Acidimicrobiales bacterium]
MQTQRTTPQRAGAPLAVTYGVRLPNSGPFATAAAIEATARQAERCGFGTVWVHDHIPWARGMVTHFSTGSIEACDGQDPNFFETVSSVAFVAGLCPGIDVGIAGLVLPLRDPRVLAKQLMTTQVLTGGRLVTALAIGNVPNDFEVMQVPFERRGRITDEFLDALRVIYDDDRSTYEGLDLRFADAEFFPKPAEPRF